MRRRGLRRSFKYLKYRIKPIRVVKNKRWVYCEIYDPNGEKWGETGVKTSLREAVTDARFWIADHEAILRTAYFGNRM